MSLSSQEVSHLVGLGLPVLCVDTCTVLDVVRDITRETVTTGDVNAGFALLSMAEEGSDLIVLMAEQVTLEIASNVANSSPRPSAFTMWPWLLEPKEISRSAISMDMSAEPSRYLIGGNKSPSWCHTTMALPAGHSGASMSLVLLLGVARSR